MDQPSNLLSDALKTVAGYWALAVPATVFLAGLSRITLEWLKQKHLISSSQIQQTHQITSEYLNKALDPSMPLAIRYQLLRFLSTSDKDGSRLSVWAKGELERSEFEIVIETNRVLAQAEKGLLAAKTQPEVEAAEDEIAYVKRKMRALLETPQPPPHTAASFRAGLVKEKDLDNLQMEDSNLVGARFPYKNLRRANFARSDISNGSFQGSILLGADFSQAILVRTSFHESDLRKAIFVGAKLQTADFREARLEGADFTDAEFEVAVKLHVTYDAFTKWPDGFDPIKAEAVLV